MTRTMSTSPPPDNERATKRPKLEHLTSDSFKNGVFLAPMVRSGALPTRLMALKHGASLVWGPEVVDKAILRAERVVDPVTGVISYNGKTRAIFTTHPIERPYLIYQIGSASPELAVQAAKTVVQDVSGVDLNCGCPKPFSTHAGMGAALLTNPDLLCDILTALRRELPPHVTVSAKIRLLPSQDDTKRLVERIVRTGVSALTVHCRTRNMRPREAALIERLREIVEFVEGLGVDIPVVANGDCQGWEDAKRVKKITGASSVMIATAAEANPSCFSSTPLQDLGATLIPSYLRLCRYIDNHWALTKFCISQFRGARKDVTKDETNDLKARIIKSKGFDELTDLIGNSSGEADFVEIADIIRSRRPRPLLVDSEAEKTLQSVSPATEEGGSSDDDGPFVATPPDRPNPEPPTSRAPLGPSSDTRIPLPAIITGSDMLTPTPTPKPLFPFGS
ncbi:hypothetical protein M404DRAFT_137681 [Pisolithus tinctorius Marx 270]|uniref:DUS-like FMN-binding domain-containing protein n=1 Tax=Pisolithus tinctorius Marx 270 TaxID=870435 RepID=A0A0C3P1Q7_PISTI|nr:hypothetical protein M404DRAFT_137681 [Pisolithus tinctorius Marx 270]